MAEHDRDQKTEQASPQRIRKAYEDGQIGFSSDLVGGVITFFGVVYFWFIGAWFFQSINETVRQRSTYFDGAISDPRVIFRYLQEDGARVGVACLSLLVPLFVVTILSGAFQTNFNVSFKPLTLKFDKLSVVAGIRKIFSLASVVRGGIAIAKSSLVLTVIYFMIKGDLETIMTTGLGSFQSLMMTMCGLLLSVAITLAAMMALLGVIDLVFQKWKQAQDLKMTVQEVKDELKDSEGDPQLKARRRRLQAEMGRNQMLAEVPKADVIIRNPTHFAVAIRYDRDEMDAPIVVAKGADSLALKIIEIAEENRVAVVERKPVARFLYFNTEIGSTIPFELYQAVAEILNYVNRLKQ